MVEATPPSRARPDTARADAPRQDVFIYTIANGMLLMGMIMLVTAVVLMSGLSIARFDIGFGWVLILFSFLLIFTGWFLAWYYRSILVKPAARKAPTEYAAYPYNYTPYYYPQQTYAPYPAAAPQAPAYAYPQAQAPAAAYAYPQAQAPAAPAAATAASRGCPSCGRAIPADSHFCPFCRQRL